MVERQACCEDGDLAGTLWAPGNPKEANDKTHEFYGLSRRGDGKARTLLAGLSAQFFSFGQSATHGSAG